MLCLNILKCINKEHKIKTLNKTKINNELYIFLIIAAATPNNRGCNQSNLGEHKHQFYIYIGTK